MSTPFLGEIKIWSCNYAPQGWAFCNGQFLQINQNQALFSLLGTTYGGNGQTTFALPDLRARIPIHVGSGHTLGDRAGETSHTLNIGEMPTHVHLGNASGAAPNAAPPAGNFWSAPGAELYAAAPDAAMRAGTVGNVGGSQAHENRSPFLALNFCIALQGTFPSRN